MDTMTVMTRCGVATPSGFLYAAPSPAPRRAHPALAAVVPSPVFVPPPAAVVPSPLEPAAPAPMPGDPWSDTPAGSLVRWEPNARLAAKGRAAVEGTLARLGRGTTTRFARIEAGGEAVQVWENQGELRVLAAAAPAAPPAPSPRSGPSPAPVERREARRAAPKPPPSPAALPGELPKARRIELPPNASKELKAYAAAVSAVEPLMILVPGPRYADLRARVAAARAAVEKGKVPEEMRHSDKFLDSLSANANAVEWAVALAAYPLLLGRPEDARDSALRTREVVEFDAGGGDWGEVLAEASADPGYRAWFADDPSLSVRVPQGPEAVEAVVQMAADDRDAWRMGDPQSMDEGKRAHAQGIAATWMHASDTCAVEERHLFNAKSWLLRVAQRRRRTGKDEGNSSLYNLRESVDKLRVCRLFAAARRAGLRDPAAAAEPRMWAAVRAKVAEIEPRIARDGAAVEPVLRAAAAALRSKSAAVAADFERSKESVRALRHPKAAGFGAELARRLAEAANVLDGTPGQNYDRRIASLGSYADGSWAWDVARDSDAQYAEAMRRFVLPHRWDVEAALAKQLRRLDWKQVDRLTDDAHELDYLTRKPGVVGPWAPLYDVRRTKMTQRDTRDWVEGRKNLTARPRGAA